MTRRLTKWALRPARIAVIALATLALVAAITVIAGSRLAGSFSSEPDPSHSRDTATAGTSTCHDAALTWATVIADRRSSYDQWVRSIIDVSTVNVAPWAPNLPREQMPTGAATVLSNTTTPASCDAVVEWASGEEWNVRLVPLSGEWLVDTWTDSEAVE